ncbi:MAG: oxidoreductase, partial [Olleya sp.]
MKKLLSFILFSILIIGISGCGITNKYKPVPKPIKKSFSKVEIETLVQDSTLNVRALEIRKSDSAVFYATSNGRIAPVWDDFLGYNGNNNENFYSNDFSSLKDSATQNYRSLAILEKSIFALSIGSPAKLVKVNFSDTIVKIVYQENHKKAFYDSLEFWNDQEGISIGDPTDNCMSVIITRDGGDTWTKLSCDVLPIAKEGEAAFAASDTNIAIVGDKTWVATGGKASRILFSSDKGKTWEVFDTPIVQGLETTGMYSLDFYDEFNGFAIGGDYTKPEDNAANKIITSDGGKTWQLIGQNQNPGYRSCVQYVPNGNARQLVAIGFKGIDYTNDAGNTWTHLSDEGFYT